MKVVLVRPFNKFSYSFTPPLGLGYMASMLKIKSNHNVFLYEANRDRLSKIKEFYNFLTVIKPQIVGIQAYSTDLPIVKEYLQIIKETDNRVITVIGGPHPSALPEESMNYFGSNLDFAIMGEGEEGFLYFVNHIEERNNSWDKIPGLVWRDKKKQLILKNKRAFISDIDKLPWPDWELLDPASYPHAPLGAFSKHFPVAPILVSRGCQMDCNFCAAKTIYGNEHRYRNIDSVIAEIEYLKDRFGIKEVMIQDDNFIFRKKIVLEFCNKVKRLNIDWNCLNGIRLDFIDDELAGTMKDAGCYAVAVGIESGSQKILDDMNKKLKIEKIIEKIKILVKHKIKIVGQFIIGYPTETYDDILRTIEFAKKLPIEHAGFAIFIPLPGSEIYIKLKKSINFDSFSNMSYYKAVESFTPYLSKNGLNFLLKKAVRSFYIRPSILFDILKSIKSFSNLGNLLKRFVKNYI